LKKEEEGEKDRGATSKRKETDIEGSEKEKDDTRTVWKTRQRSNVQ
jgi:hypothetical protein